MFEQLVYFDRLIILGDPLQPTYLASSVTSWWNKKQPKILKKLPKSGHTSFTLNVFLFKIAQKVAKYLSYFYKEICGRELSIITQSGHTAVASEQQVWKG